VIVTETDAELPMKTVITRGGLVSAYEGKNVTAYADGETADLVKSSQVNLLIVPKVTSTDVWRTTYERSQITFLIPPRLHLPQDDDWLMRSAGS
jgi:hypothetical protein